MENDRPITLVDVMERNAELYPEKTAIIFKDNKISHKTLYDKTNAVAHHLIDSGLKKGERVGLIMKKSPDAIISFLGVITAGGIVFTIDYNHNIAHIQYMLNLTSPSFLIIEGEFKRILNEVNITCPMDNIIMRGDQSASPGQSLEKIYLKKKFQRPDIQLDIDDIAYLNFTSGTTGIPKGAVTTHKNIYWNTVSSNTCLDITHEDIHLCMFPIFGHPHEIFCRPLFLGGTFVLIDNISPKSIAQAISDHNVTCFMAVASIYETLVRLDSSFDRCFGSLRLPESGGMHFTPSLAKKFKERYGTSVVPVWGSTETAGIAIATSIKEGYRESSCGKPCPYYEIKIIDENGTELADGEIGELYIKGHGVCKEYLDNPEETSKHMKNGWLASGDMVKKDSEGYIYFASRKSGMMKVAGLKVFPTEIEDVIRSHPQVSEVVVVKSLDGLHGEVPKAFIVKQEGSNIEKRDIRKFCEQKISKYKIPRIIEFRTALPKTPGGKIAYRELAK